VFRAAGSKSVGTTGAVTVTAPVGVATGDLEILVSSTIAGATISITSDGGSAWTALGNQDVTAGERVYVWYRVRQGGDGNPQVTPSSDHSCSVRLAYTTGTFDATTPIENWTTSSETTSDTSFSWAPGYSTTNDYSLVLCVATSGFDSNTAQVPVNTNANLASLASRANYETSNGAGGGFGITEGRLDSHGAVGTFACTYVTASAKAYVSFSINKNTAATAWTVIYDSTSISGRSTAAWKVAVGSDPAFTVTVGGSNSHQGRCLTFSGADTTTPFPTLSAVSSESGSGGGGTANANSIDPIYTDSYVVWITAVREPGTSGAGANIFSAYSGTNPTFTEATDDSATDGANAADLGTAYGSSDGAATGGRTVTLSGIDTGSWLSLTYLMELAAPQATAASLLWQPPSTTTLYIR
jgi:hypothetical protein